MNNERLRRISAYIDGLLAEQAPLLAELRAIGVDVPTVRDLIGLKLSNPATLPILLRHLNRPYNTRTRGAIARVLATKEARFAFPTLVEAYIATAEQDQPELKKALAEAISTTANRRDIATLMALVCNPSHGNSRLAISFRLSRWKDPAIETARAVLKQESEEGKRQRLIFAEEMRLDQAPIVAELRAAGFHVRSVWDLVNTADPYPAALPILAGHLHGNYHDRNLAGVARALAIKAGRPYRPQILELFLSISLKGKPWFKEGLAVALANMATSADVDELLDLTADPIHGNVRIILADRLCRFRRPDLATALALLSFDPDLWRVLEKKRIRSPNAVTN